jgi:hypothetical protein
VRQTSRLTAEPSLNMRPMSTKGGRTRSTVTRSTNGGMRSVRGQRVDVQRSTVGGVSGGMCSALAQRTHTLQVGLLKPVPAPSAPLPIETAINLLPLQAVPIPEPLHRMHDFQNVYKFY